MAGAGRRIASAGGVACVVVGATGKDSRVDSVQRLVATRPSASGDGLEAFDFDAASGGPIHEAWAQLRDFVGERPVLTDDAEMLEVWGRALDLSSGVTADALEYAGLDELAMLLEPGELATRTSFGIAAALLPTELVPPPGTELLPLHVLAAAAELVARLGDLGPHVHAVVAFGWRRALRGLGGSDPTAARRLALALALVDRPSAWATNLDVFAPGRLVDGLIEKAEVSHVDEDDPLGELAPAVTRQLEELTDVPQLAPEPDGHAPFEGEDLAILDDLFREHLPNLFAGRGSRSPEDLYRRSQHRVAEEIARCLGSDELLLVHAPTGTGKTLAYLVPALIWARRHAVRVGVATYTRALQSQAMEREVPRAIEALRRAGYEAGFRVCVLKGREHSLCWRSLRAHVPSSDDEAEAWLAWTTLSLFGLRDGDGDLDRFPWRAPIRMDSTQGYRSALASLLMHARARSGCCTKAPETCAAEVARFRAERSHVVLTNQSFALARPEFFRRVVFDECEHLHDQAMSAWSHRVGFREMRRVLTRLHEPPSDRARGAISVRRRAPLDRLRNTLPVGSGAAERLHSAHSLWTNAMSAVARLEAEVLAYEKWRVDAARQRAESDHYSLFRDYVMTTDEARGLVDARNDLVTFFARLEGTIAALGEELEHVNVRRRSTIRRALDLVRIEISDVARRVAHWVPTDDGIPRFGDDMFHDVERTPSGEHFLVALVLLPGDILGAHYYPELGAAAFVSATTRLDGSFDSAKGYLGLDCVAEKRQSEHPDEPDEYDRTAGTRRVTTFHAPEVFDYGRVLVGMPRGVPAVRDRAAYIDFLARYLPWMAERTRGRMLCLFTSLADIRAVAEVAGPRFDALGLPLLWQGMEAAGKEELSALFRERVDSTLLGVDTFWYGADFPGETLEVLAMVRLPYGVPDRYHHAQCAAIGISAQRHRIYLPRALAKFRQGFGRLMRTATDRGVVMVLDGRITERRHGMFLKELPVARPGAFQVEGRAKLVRGDLDRVGHEAFAHLGLLSDLQRRGVSPMFERPGAALPTIHVAGREEPPPPPKIEIDDSDVPY